MSQNFIVKLIFCFIVCRRRENHKQNHKSYPFLVKQKKLGPKFKKMKTRFPRSKCSTYMLKKLCMLIQY